MSKSTNKKQKDEQKDETTTTTTTTNSLKQRNVTKKDEDKTTSTTTTTTTIDNKPSTDKIKLNYPVFCCASSVDAKHAYIVTGGGGGISKTGVPNAITLLKWKNDDSNNSSEFQLIDQMDTPDCIPFVTFNESKNQIAYGVGSICYIVKYENNKLEKVSQFDTNQGIPSNAYQLAIDVANSTNTNSASSPTTTTPSLTPSLTPGSSSSTAGDQQSSTTTTTTSPTDGDIRIIRFNKKGDRIIIVDTNNLIKVWSVPSFEFIRLISSGHTGEITDLDIHPASTHIVTTSRDCSARLINLFNGRSEFTLLHKNKPKLAFRGCKFTNDGLFCFTAQSMPRSKQTIGCTVLSKWNFTNGNEEFTKEVDTAHNTVFSLSPDNKIVTIATADGKITAFNSDTFKQLDKWEPHDFVITGACFSPDSCSIFSSSADYNCKSHRIGFNQNNNSKLFKILLVIAIFILIISLILGQFNKL